MNSDITNIVRSVVFLGCALPLTIALANRVGVGTEVARQELLTSPAEQVIIDLKNDLTKVCIDYKLSKSDSTVERKAKTAIDEAFDGEVLYNTTCNFVLS